MRWIVEAASLRTATTTTATPSEAKRVFHSSLYLFSCVKPVRTLIGKFATPSVA